MVIKFQFNLSCTKCTGFYLIHFKWMKSFFSPLFSQDKNKSDQDKISVRRCHIWTMHSKCQIIISNEVFGLKEAIIIFHYSMTVYVFYIDLFQIIIKKYSTLDKVCLVPVHFFPNFSFYSAIQTIEKKFIIITTNTFHLR